MKKLILLAILFSISTIPSLNAQSKQTQKEQFQSTYNNMKSLVESQVFDFVGDVVFAGRTREKLNNDINTITINKSQASGSIISLKSKNKSFDLNGDVEDYQTVSDDDKQNIFIQFKVKSPTQTLDVNIEIKPNGNATLTASSGTNNSITWVGYIK